MATASMPQTRQNIIRVVARHARPIINAYTRIPNNCVAATRIVKDALAQFGVESQPLLCQLRVTNKRLLTLADRWMRANPGEKVTLEQMEQWHHEGAYEVCIGYGDDPGGWDDNHGLDGHVVLHVPKRGLVIDASADQVNRPAKGIVLQPVFVFNASRRFVLGGEPAAFKDDAGAILQYDVIPHRTEWQAQSNDWQRNGHYYRSAVRELVDIIRSEGGA